MKVFANTFLLSLLLLPMHNLWAGTSSLTINYPATSGSYNKIILVNQKNPSSSNFCTANPNGTLFINADVPPTSDTGNLDICINSKVVPFNQTCFNRFCLTGSAACAALTCPSGYAPQGAPLPYHPPLLDNFQTTDGTNISSAVCCSTRITPA